MDLLNLAVIFVQFSIELKYDTNDVYMTMTGRR